MRKASTYTDTIIDDNAQDKYHPITQLVYKLSSIKIWMPYAVNQLGSLLYYKLLASSRLTVSVPICNATAMVFSCVTSVLFGERVDKPWRAGLGVVLIVVGSGICMIANENDVVRDDPMNDEL